MSVEVTRLPSGLSVVTDRMPHLESASLGVWAGAGSRNEAPDEHGISHLLEHMAFKGTKRRTSRQIAEEIEAVGGDLNASTSAESTGFYARVLKADVPLALDVLSDILSEPTFEPEELRRARKSGATLTTTVPACCPGRSRTAWVSSVGSTMRSTCRCILSSAATAISMSPASRSALSSPASWPNCRASGRPFPIGPTT